MTAPSHRPVLVVDFGAQYAQLIARRVREAKVYSEVIPHTTTVEEIVAKNPLAVVLSGGPSSVYADGAPKLDPALFDHDIPVFGICYGFQAMAGALGGTVAENMSVCLLGCVHAAMTLVRSGGTSKAVLAGSSVWDL